MYKKNINFTDYNGNKHEETFYFNLSTLDIHKLDKAYPDGFAAAYEAAVKSSDSRLITDIFIDLIMRSYGKKSDDGMHFDKNEELSEAFVSGPAFEALLEELTSDQNAMTDFFYGIIPQNLQNRAASNPAA